MNKNKEPLLQPYIRSNSFHFVVVVPQLKFCFIHVNWFFTKIVKNTLEYFPAEYSVGVFSLENGIEDVHHVIVGAQIPLGYRREALETSQSTHNIPVENPNGEMDFAVMYEKLINFLESRKIVHKYPPLFTTKALKPAVKSLLGRLSEAAGNYTFLRGISIQNNLWQILKLHFCPNTQHWAGYKSFGAPRQGDLYITFLYSYYFLLLICI